MVAFDVRPTYRGGNDLIAPRRLTKFVGNGHADTPAICCRKRPTTPLAALPPPGTPMSRFCATLKKKSARSSLNHRFTPITTDLTSSVCSVKIGGLKCSELAP